MEVGGGLCKNASENALLADLINPPSLRHQTTSRKAILNEQNQKSKTNKTIYKECANQTELQIKEFVSEMNNPKTGRENLRECLGIS